MAVGGNSGSRWKQVVVGGSIVLITSKRHMKTANVIHLKYVDDLTMAEAVNLTKKLTSV